MKIIVSESSSCANLYEGEVKNTLSTNLTVCNSIDEASEILRSSIDEIKDSSGDIEEEYTYSPDKKIIGYKIDIDYGWDEKTSYIGMIIAVE